MTSTESVPRWAQQSGSGLPRLRFHDLRHTAAMLLLAAGMHPKERADLLGHTNVTLTLDTYSHVTAAMHRDAVAAMERLLRARRARRTGTRPPSGGWLSTWLSPDRRAIGTRNAAARC